MTPPSGTSLPPNAPAALGPTDFTAVFAALPDAAAVYAADAPRFTVLAVSDALVAAAGRPREALVGLTLAEAFPEAGAGDAGGDEAPAESLASLRASLAAAVRTGAPQRMPQQRYDLQRPDGSWETRYWDAVNVPVRGPDGVVRCVLHRTEDVTARVLGARALARAERRAADVLDRMADAHYVLDRDFRIVATNPAAERASGKARDELLGRTHWELFPASVDTDTGRAYRRVVAEGVAQHVTQHYVGEGYDQHLEVDAYPTDEGGVAIFWRDVTARVRAEAALAAERERLKALLLQLPTPVAVVEGPELRYALVNDAFRRVTGPRPDFVGKTPLEAFPELAGQGYVELLEQVYATGEPWVGPETLTRYDRTGRGVEDAWFDSRFDPLFDADGRVVAVLNMAIDVSERVRARRATEGLLAESEAARREAEATRAAAEEANAAKSQFLANMSHELRTPLNAIGGYVQLLDMGLHGPVTDAQRAALARVQGAQTRLLSLINDVLNYAKLEGGRVEYDLAPVDVRDVVADVAPLVEPQLAAKGLALDVRLPETPCVVWADRAKLGQVLVNLLSNAAKFTDAGRVTVDVATRRGATAGAGDAVFLRVADTGRGIPRDRQDAIFDPFVQVATGYARTQEGTGLGLAISRDLARGMGGDLRVRSREGEGAAFTVVLRRAA